MLAFSLNIGASPSAPSRPHHSPVCFGSHFSCYRPEIPSFSIGATMECYSCLDFLLPPMFWGQRTCKGDYRENIVGFCRHKYNWAKNCSKCSEGQVPLSVNVAHRCLWWWWWPGSWQGGLQGDDQLSGVSCIHIHSEATHWGPTMCCAWQTSSCLWLE